MDPDTRSCIDWMVRREVSTRFKQEDLSGGMLCSAHRNKHSKSKCVFSRNNFWYGNGRQGHRCAENSPKADDKRVPASLVSMVTQHHGFPGFDCSTSNIFEYSVEESDEDDDQVKEVQEQKAAEEDDVKDRKAAAVVTFRRDNVYLLNLPCKDCAAYCRFNDGMSQLISFDSQKFNCCMCGTLFTMKKSHYLHRNMLRMCLTCQATGTEKDLEKTKAFMNRFLLQYLARVLCIKDLGLDAEVDVGGGTNNNQRVDFLLYRKTPEGYQMILTEIDLREHRDYSKEKEREKNVLNKEYCERASARLGKGGKFLIVRLNVPTDANRANSHYLVFRAWVASFLLYPDLFPTQGLLYLHYGENKNITRDLMYWSVQNKAPAGLFNTATCKPVPTMAVTGSPWLALMLDTYYKGDTDILHVFSAPKLEEEEEEEDDDEKKRKKKVDNKKKKKKKKTN